MGRRGFGFGAGLLPAARAEQRRVHPRTGEEWHRLERTDRGDILRGAGLLGSQGHGDHVSPAVLHAVRQRRSGVHRTEEYRDEHARLERASIHFRCHLRLYQRHAARAGGVFCPVTVEQRVRTPLSRCGGERRLLRQAR